MCFMFLIGAKAQVTLGKEQAINMVTITEGSHPHIQEYQLDYRINGEWKPLLDGNQTGRVKIHRFDTIYGDLQSWVFIRKEDEK